MKIFDTLSSADAQVTVIDVRAGLLSTTLPGAARASDFSTPRKKAQLSFTGSTFSAPRSPRSAKSTRPQASWTTPTTSW
jgi:hypothetical protein